MTLLAIPIKDLGFAKQRLRDLLRPGERVELARAMLRDVLRAVVAARLDAVWVVTRDADAISLARDFGAEILREEANQGHTAAVALAQARATRAGVRVFATVPGDVPCVTAGEIDRLVASAHAGAARVALAPSGSRLGTNGVALNPPDAMPLTFGEPSFERHVATARHCGLDLEVVALPGLALDVDGADDLRALLARGPHTDSGRLVAAWSLAVRGPERVKELSHGLTGSG